MDLRRPGSTLTVSDRAPAPASVLAPGTQIDRFVVGQRLGAGGMGVVYSAYDAKLDRFVALKSVRSRPDGDAMQARLQHEAKAMAKLKHRNVVPIYDLVGHAGQLFLAMELIEGSTLNAWLAGGRSWREVVRMFAGAGRGLAAAHAAGLLHRDFKPDNVMVDRAGDARITDFGLARVLSDETTMAGDGEAPVARPGSVTVTGRIAGTPAYMAPEVFDARSVGPAADQFSFCVALFEALYGARPFAMTNANPAAVVDEVLAARVARLPLRGVPRRLHAAIIRGLAYDPARRWPSVADLVDALERAVRDRKALFYACTAILVAIIEIGPSLPTPSCLQVARKRDAAVTALVCREEFARTRDPQAGAQLADALRRSELPRDAEAVATGLLATPARADALYTLGKVAHNEDRRDDAIRYFRLAAESHREQKQWSGAAEDLSALAACLDAVVEKLVALEQSVIEARRGGDAKIEAYSHIHAALVLSTIQARAAALAELERARVLFTRPSDELRLDLERGNVHQNLGDQALAAAAFERSFKAAVAAGNTRRASSALLNQVYSLAESGDLETAALRLKDAAVLDATNDMLPVRLSIEARIAAHTGALDRAAGLVEQALAKLNPADRAVRIEYETQRAQIAVQQGDLAGGEQWARRAIADIERRGAAIVPPDLRSWLITDQRTPYEVLFTSLVRRGDARGALLVFDRYSGAAALAGLVHRDVAVSGAPALAFPAVELASQLTGLQTSAIAVPASEQATLAAARLEALLVLVVAGGDVWRISGESGRLTIARIGELATLQGQLEHLLSRLGDGAAASALGDLLVPPELAVVSDQPLHVVLDPSLASLPTSALRVDGRLLIAARPVVRAARVSDLGCAAPVVGAPRVVLLGADIGSAGLGDQASVRTSEATRAGLFDVRRGELLHLGSSISGNALATAILLRDGSVSALEIAGHGSAPAQVVLAVPGSVPSAELALAFVAAGADQVVATVGPVSSASAAAITQQIYRSDTSDLVRALARIQATSNEADWRGFAVFGRAMCHGNH